MTNVRLAISFFLLVLLQVLVLNNILFTGYLNPYVYVLFVLFLPLNTRRSSTLLLAFALGACIDIFENSGGIHAAATVCLAFARRAFLKITTQKRGVDFEGIIINRLPLRLLILYGFMGIFTHHLVLFLIESFNLRDIGSIMLQTLVSSLFTTLIALGIHFSTFRKKD